MTWQYPQNPQPPAQSRPIGTSLPSHTQQRRKDWQESLCSLYDALRTGQCSAFYVVSPQLPSGIGKQPFTVLFTAVGVKGNKKLQAVMGTSSAGVRSVLKMQGVDFETPLIIASSTSYSTASRFATSSIDNTTRSMLVFNGALQVHALFDFLLNRAFTLLDNVCDVPVLLAPVQFTHAAIKKFTLSATTSTAAVAAGGAGTSKGARKGHVNTAKTLHTLDVKGGMIPGWVADRLLCVLTSEDSLNSQNENSNDNTTAAINMVSAPFPASVALNWHVSTPPTSKSNVALHCIGGCVSDAEAQRWSSTLEGLDTAAVREMKFTLSSCGTIKGKGGDQDQDQDQAKGKYQIVQATNRILPVNV
jgi:protein downstream neighbor of Son